MFRRLAIFSLALCAALPCTRLAAEETEKKAPRRPTYRVSVETGDGQKQSKTFKGNIPSEELIRPPTAAGRKNLPAADRSSSAVSSKNRTPPVIGTPLPDGRTLPFQYANSLGKKNDAESNYEEEQLKSFFRREENLSMKNYSPGQWQGGKFSDHREKQANIISHDQWGQKFNFWNKQGEQSSIDLTNTFSAKIRERQTISFDAYADGQRPTSPLSGDFSNLRNQDQRYEQSLHDRYLAQKSVPFKEMMTQRYQKLNNLSMQDINRYQFRHNRSSTPGIPAVTPDGQMRQ